MAGLGVGRLLLLLLVLQQALADELLNAVEVVEVDNDLGSGDKSGEKEVKCPDRCVCAIQQAYCDNIMMTRLPRALPKDIITLSMHNNQVRKLHRKHFEDLTSLKHLILKSNRISYIEPTAFKDMYQLKALSLTENFLRRLSPHTFKSLSNLQVLSLRDNRLINVEKVFYNVVSLKLLNLASNKLKKVTDKTFKRNTQLTILDLNNNRIKLIEKDAFRSLPLLKYLVLRDNPLKVVELDFGSNHHLELLDFTNCKLSQFVKGLPYSISDLRMSENRLTKIVKDDLKSSKKIRLLVLSNNRLESIEEDALSHLAQLYDLYLGGNNLQELPTNLPRSLHGLYMNYNNVSLLERHALHRCPKLQQFTLSHNNVQSVHSRALRGLESLQNLDLSYNAIDIVEPMTFADNNQLRKLDLSHNPLVELGKYCFHGLEYLHILQISSVDTKARLLPAIFQDTKSLLFLDMSSSPSMASHLASHPHYISSVEDLNLMNDSLRTLPPSFHRYMPKLQVVKLGGNPWHCDFNILPLVHWMRNQSANFHEPYSMRCASPHRLKGRMIYELTLNDLQPPTTTKRPFIKIDLGDKVVGNETTDLYDGENATSLDIREPKTHKISTQLQQSDSENSTSSMSSNDLKPEEEVDGRKHPRQHPGHRKRRKLGRRRKLQGTKVRQSGERRARREEEVSEDSEDVFSTSPGPVPQVEPPKQGS